MPGPAPTPRTPRLQAVWPAQLHRGAIWLAAGAFLYWMAFAFGGWTVWVNGVGIIYIDLLLAWVGVLLNVLAWPEIWDGLKSLLGGHRQDVDALVARRALFTILALAGASLAILPFEYRAVAPSGLWILSLYITTYPYLAWLFVPTLALYGILFGRVGNFLSPLSKRLADAGAMVLFAVAAATTALVLHIPGTTAFAQSWSVGFGTLPAAACAGFVLIAAGVSHRGLPEPRPTRGWALAKTPRAKERWA